MCGLKEMTVDGLAHSAAIPRSTLGNIVYGTSRNPGIVTIKKLCNGLDISIIEFFDTPEFRALEHEIE